MLYTKVPKVLMSLLLTAFLIGCNADAPSQRDKLVARKERLINKLSDSIYKLVLLIKSSTSTASTENFAGKDEKEIPPELVEIWLMGLCGALESRDETIAKVLAVLVDQDDDDDDDDALLLRIIQQSMIDAEGISREKFFHLLELLALLKDADKVRQFNNEETLAKLDIVLGDITDLLKVVKQLRELA